MPLSPSFLDFVLEQLERVAPVTSRRMFGALGLYADGKIFAIVDDDTLFFKVDDTTRPDYEAAGMPPFSPSATMVSKNYFQVPADVSGQYIVVWYTKLNADDRGKRRAWLNEVVVTG